MRGGATPAAGSRVSVHVMTKARHITAEAKGFGQVIRRLRLAEGWTIANLARRSGVNKNHLQVLEAGQNMPSLNILFLLAEVFRVDAADMVREVERARRGRKEQRAAAMLAAAGLPAPPAESRPDEPVTG